jgi:hypothetical protein
MAANNQEALQDLARHLKLSLAFNADNVCDLVVDDAVITCEGDPDGTTLQMNGIVGDLPDSQDAALLKVLLIANFNGQGVGTARLGMDHISEEIVLGRTIDVTRLPETGLAGELESFANYLHFWRKQLPKSAAEAAQGTATPEPVHAGMRV